MKLVLLILFPIIAQAQKLPVTGEVLADSNFICVDKLQSDSSAFGIREICNSENYLEIRLKTYVMASSELIIFSFNNNEWTAERYFFDYITKKRKVVSVIPKQESKKDSSGLFNTIFDSLQSEKLFLLPDQRILKSRLVIFHGVGYTITFKVGNLYRRYNYSSPKENAKYYPQVPEYRQVIEIVTLLNNIF